MARNQATEKTALIQNDDLKIQVFEELEYVWVRRGKFWMEPTTGIKQPLTRRIRAIKSALQGFLDDARPGDRRGLSALLQGGSQGTARIRRGPAGDDHPVVKSIGRTHSPTASGLAGACRPRPSGNTPRAAARRATSTPGQPHQPAESELLRQRASLEGTSPVGSFSPMDTASTTWLEMFGSGVPIGLRRTTTRSLRNPIPRVPTKKPTHESFGAVRGAATRAF